MSVSKEGKIAISEITNLAHDHNFSLAKVHILTGRTHQIRVHCNYLNHPILGDEVYGSTAINKKYNAKRQMLHAYKISFNHPIKNSKINLSCPPPVDFQNYLKKFELEISL